MSNSRPYIIIQCPNCNALLPEGIVDPTSFCMHCSTNYNKPIIDDIPSCNRCNDEQNTLVIFKCKHAICIHCWYKLYCPICE
jgi:hypothetical protein